MVEFIIFIISIAITVWSFKRLKQKAIQQLEEKGESENDINVKANVIPGCFSTVIWLVSFVVLLALGIGMGIIDETEDDPQNESKINIPTEQALDFIVYDLGTGMGIGEMVIFSEAKTFEERAHTTLNAAIKHLEQEDVDFVRACHLSFGHKILVGTGSCIAIAEYFRTDRDHRYKNKDLKHGNWEVRAYRGEVDQIKSMTKVMWYMHRDKYQIEDDLGSYTDEPALKKAISEMLKGKLKPEDITLPYYPLEDL